MQTDNYTSKERDRSEGSCNESISALKSLLIAIASNCPDGGAEYKPGDLIAAAKGRGLIKAITAQAKDPCKALAHVLQKTRGYQFTDEHGRHFLLGKWHKSSGLVYTIRFVDVPCLEAAKSVTGDAL